MGKPALPSIWQVTRRRYPLLGSSIGPMLPPPALSFDHSIDTEPTEE